ncbi:MAG TPA: hypothetical protein VK629_19490 [Steroidobacteraceae bacterium]|nr:hypothetical protein [Steroidobacteraceae bacterium]
MIADASGIRLLRSILCCSIAIVFGAGAAIAKDKGYQPPRLADGHVDLQGMWEMTNLLPMERARNYQSLVITEAEAAKVTADAARRQEDPTVIDSDSFFRRPRRLEPIRGEFRSSMVIDPPDGHIPFTAQQTERRRIPRPRGMATGLDGPEARSTMERCIASDGAPLFRAIPSNNLHQFVQTANMLLMQSEEIPQSRIVRIGGQHGPSTVHTYAGDSIGWWEGDTLVVETKHFRPASYVSPKSTVTERFTRIADKELLYHFTIEDSDYYTRPWTAENHFLLGQEKMLEYACHEGNYSLTHILQAARWMEKPPGK